MTNMLAFLKKPLQFSIQCFDSLLFSKAKWPQNRGFSHKTANSGVHRCMTAKCLYAKLTQKIFICEQSMKICNFFAVILNIFRKFDFFSRLYLAIRQLTNWLPRESTTLWGTDSCSTSSRASVSKSMASWYFPTTIELAPQLMRAV